MVAFMITALWKMYAQLKIMRRIEQVPTPLEQFLLVGASVMLVISLLMIIDTRAREYLESRGKVGCGNSTGDVLVSI